MLALNYYHQALMADTGAKDPRGRALRQERLGRTFLDLKDYDRAAVYLKEALGEFRRLQDTDGIAAALKDLTLLALARGDQAGGGAQRPAPPGHLPGPGPGAGSQGTGGAVG